MVNGIEERRLHWLEHIIRMVEKHSTKCLINRIKEKTKSVNTKENTWKETVLERLSLEEDQTEDKNAMVAGNIKSNPWKVKNGQRLINYI